MYIVYMQPESRDRDMRNKFRSMLCYQQFTQRLTAHALCASNLKFQRQNVQSHNTETYRNKHLKPIGINKHG
jgi:hypothetical protein